MIKINDEQKTKLLQQYNVFEEIHTKNGIIDKLNHIHLAELIYHGLDLHFLTIIDNEEIYYYNGAYYEPHGEQIIKDLVKQFLDENDSEHYKKEIIGHIRDSNYQKREVFDNNPYLINLQNGVYDIKHNKFLEHDPQYYFQNTLPINYDKKAKIKEIKKFLKSTVYTDDIPLLQEIFGYCLYREYLYHKAFMFIGDGANGKSTVLNLLKSMLGQNNVSGVALQDLDDSRFAIAELYNKLANIYPDISSNSLHRTGKFKMLTGSDMVSAEKKFKGRFNFVNHAKLIYSCNKLPEAHDDTDAYFRRWVIVTFPHKFEGKNCDHKLLEKITTEKELSGLFNWSLTGLRRLLRNGTFSNTRGTQEVREQYIRMASPIAAFVMDCIEICSTAYMKKDDLYAFFCEYCEKNGLPMVAKNVFSMRLHEHVRVNDYRATISGKRENCWSGIKPKEDGEDVRAVRDVPYFNIVDTGTQVYKVEKYPDNIDNPDFQEGLDVT